MEDVPEPRRSSRAPPPPPPPLDPSPPPQQPAARTPATEGATSAGRQLCDCQGGVATKAGVCGMEGCNNKSAMSGCRTAGYRFCLWSCMNRHMKGFGKLKRQKIEVEWKDGEWYAHGMG